MIQATDGTSYKVVDTHCHIYKEKIAAKASDAIGDFYKAPGTRCDVEEMFDKVPTAKELLRVGAEAGVDKYLIFSVATKPKQVASINQFIADECAQHPDKFVGLGTAHQDCEDFDAVLDQIQELGLLGVKLHPDMQHFNTDDKRMMPLYRGIEERGLVLLVHVGDERWTYSDPIRLYNVMDKFPDLRVHAAHLGCCRTWYRRPIVLAPQVFRGAHIVFDTSSMLKWAPVDEVREVIDTYGTDYVMWGTDFPMWSPAEEIQRLLALGYGPEDNRKMFYDNFARFYNLG